MDRQGAFGGVLASVERVGVRAALALGVEVDAPDLVGEGVDQAADGYRVGAEDAQLLAEVRFQDVIDHRVQMTVRHDGHHWAELFFLVNAHLRGHRVQHGRVEERGAGFATIGIDHSGAFADGIGHQRVQVVDLARLR
ncbi:hypothetical protein D3C87_1557520 [compost metagenome]